MASHRFTQHHSQVICLVLQLFFPSSSQRLICFLGCCQALSWHSHKTTSHCPQASLWCFTAILTAMRSSVSPRKLYLLAHLLLSRSVMEVWKSTGHCRGVTFTGTVHYPSSSTSLLWNICTFQDYPIWSQVKGFVRSCKKSRQTISCERPLCKCLFISSKACKRLFFYRSGANTSQLDFIYPGGLWFCASMQCLCFGVVRLTGL